MPRDVLFIIDDRRIGVADADSINRDYQKFTAVLNKIALGKFPLEGSAEALWSARVFDGASLTDLLYGKHKNMLDRDLSLLLLQIMGRVSFTDLSGAESEKHAEERLKSGVAAALVVSPAHEEVRDVGQESFHLHFIGTEAGLAQFHRAVPVYANYTESELLEQLPHAFPSLFFHEKLDIGKFDEKYPAIREKLLNALAYLNDRFRDALHEWGNQPGKIERDFKALCRGVGGISQETSDTMRRHGRQREVRVRETSVFCEWHVKLRPHIDRVHFAYEEKYRAAADGKIIVGIFTDHLDV
jgi:hypothetical protein